MGDHYIIRGGAMSILEINNFVSITLEKNKEGPSAMEKNNWCSTVVEINNLLNYEVMEKNNWRIYSGSISVLKDRQSTCVLYMNQHFSECCTKIT